MKLQKYKEAIRCFDKALEMRPDYFDVLKDKGVALDKLGRHKEALDCFDEGLEIDRTHL